LSIRLEQRRQIDRERRGGNAAVRLATGVGVAYKRIRNALEAAVTLTASEAGRLRPVERAGVAATVETEAAAAGDAGTERSRSGSGEAEALGTTARDRVSLPRAVFLAAPPRR
jgi:hypothetical protein